MKYSSQRYKKALVTVLMGFRTEEDIKRNGLMIYEENQNQEAYKYIYNLYKKSNYVLILKVKKTGYRSIHYIIDNDKKINKLKETIDDILNKKDELWVINSSIKYCWRCRLALSLNNEDFIEMAYSNDDHILNNIENINKVKYINYNFRNNKIIKTNLNKKDIEETSYIVNDIKNKFMKEINKVKENMNILNVSVISLDIRVDNGYDFHDFDVAYDKIEKVIDYYIKLYNN